MPINQLRKLFIRFQSWPFQEAFPCPKNRLAQPSLSSSQSGLKDSLRRSAVCHRLFAANSLLSARRPSRVRLSRWESQGYCWPLMEAQALPVSRAYSRLRIVSRALPRWRRTGNVSNKMAAVGAWFGLRVEVRNAFHLSLTARRIFRLCFGPNH